MKGQLSHTGLQWSRGRWAWRWLSHALGWQEREAEWSRGNGAGGFSSPCPACQAQLSSPKAGSGLWELPACGNGSVVHVITLLSRCPSHKNSTEHSVILLLGRPPRTAGPSSAGEQDPLNPYCYKEEERWCWKSLLTFPSISLQK